jgi:hypothetical protein
MRWEHEVDRALEHWMQDGPEALPDRVLTDALVVVDRVPQRRFPGLAQPQPGMVLAAAVVVLMIAASLFWLAPERVGPSPEPTGPRSLEPSDIIDVDAALGLAVADGELWATSDEALVRIDPETGGMDSFPVPIGAGNWSGLAVTGDTLWTGSYSLGTVYRIDRRTGQIEAEIDTLTRTVSITAVPGGVWVAVGEGQAQFIGDDATTAGEPIPAGTSLSYGHGSLWIGNTGRPVIIRADPVTGETVAEIEVPLATSCWAAAVGGAVWSGPCFGTSTELTRIDPLTNEVLTNIDTGVWPGVIEIDGATWVLGAKDGVAKLQRIDLATDEFDREFVIGPGVDPNAGVVLGDSLWVPNDGQSAIWRFPLSDIGSP